MPQLAILLAPLQRLKHHQPWTMCKEAIRRLAKYGKMCHIVTTLQGWGLQNFSRLVGFFIPIWMPTSALGVLKYWSIHKHLKGLTHDEMSLFLSLSLYSHWQKNYFLACHNGSYAENTLGMGWFLIIKVSSKVRRNFIYIYIYTDIHIYTYMTLNPPTNSWHLVHQLYNSHLEASKFF